MIKQEKFDRLRAKHTAKPKIRIRLFYYSIGDGNGDLLYNTCREILDRKDTDEWAHRALEQVFTCLDLGMRWTVQMNDMIFLGEERRLDMTQDPWILAYCCAVHLNRKDLIEQHKPNFFMFLPDKWAWRRALLSKPNLYWLWRKLTPHNQLQDFVYVFYGYMDKAYLDIK